MKGILLLNLGGPEKLGDVRPFLFNLFSDPEIIRLKFKFMQKPLAWIISTTRYRKSSAYYEQIGGGSPLRKITDEQAVALRKELHERGLDVKVYVGMRYWHPFTNEALYRIGRDGITELLVLPLYPQFSVSTTGSSTKELYRLLRREGSFSKLRRKYVTRWYSHPRYIKALADQIRQELGNFPKPDQAHLLFSAHSVPQSYIEEGDPYLYQTQETVRLVMEELAVANPVHLCFQSKVGPVKWLEPATESLIRELKEKGADQLLMIPVSFVSEHIETLYELDILYRNLASEIGIAHYHRVPAFNCDPEFIGALADIASEALAR